MSRGLRALLAVMALALAVAGLGIASWHLGFADSAGSPTSPSATPTDAHPDWLRSPESASRTAGVEVTLSPDGGHVYVRARVRLEIDRDDPLAVRTQTQGVDAGALADAVGLSRYTPSGSPAIQWSREGTRAVITFDLVDFHFLGDGDKIEVGSLRPGWPLGAVARREVTVRATGGLVIESVAGGDLVWLDSHVASFDGPPQALSVTIDGTDDAPASAQERDISFERVTSTSSGAILLLTMAPWLMLMVGLTSAHDRGASGTLAPLAVAAAIFSLLAVGEMIFDVVGGSGQATVLICAVLLGVALLRVSRGQRWWNGGLLVTLGVIAVAGPVGAYLAARNEGEALVIDPAWSAGGLLLAIGAGAAANALLGYPPAPGAVAAAGVAGLTSLTVLGYSDPDSEAIVVSISGLSVVALLVTGADVNWKRSSAARTNGVVVLAGLLGLLLLAPVAGLVGDPSAAYGDWEDNRWDTTASASLTLLLVAVLVRYLRRRGSGPRALSDPLDLDLLLVLLLVVTIEFGDVPWLNVPAVVCTVVLWRWLTSADEVRAVATLPKVSSVQHVDLVRAEVRRRLTQLSAHDLYRRARSALPEGSLKLEKYDEAQGQLDDAASPLNKEIDGVPLALALSTGAGQRPWANAVAAMRYAVPLTVVFAGYEMWLLATGEDDSWMQGTVPHLGVLLLHQLRWLGYAAIFGYLYPWLRGRAPVTKALCLLVTVLPAELLSMLSSVPRPDPEGARSDMVLPTLGEVAQAGGIRTGQLLMFFLILALCWERRLAGLAGFGWDRLRNVRSARALATPVSAVLVTVATAAATALAGAAVAAMLTTGTSPQNAPSPTPSSTSAP